MWPTIHGIPPSSQEQKFLLSFFCLISFNLLHIYDNAINALIRFYYYYRQSVLKCISLQGYHPTVLGLHVSHMPGIEVLAAAWHYFFLLDK